MTTASAAASSRRETSTRAASASRSPIRPVARNLLKGGHRVTVYNRTPGRAKALAAEGVHVVESPYAAGQGDVLISLLSDDRAVKLFF